MTIDTLTRSLGEVHDELYRLGFLTDKMHDVDAYLVWWGVNFGYYWNGDIYIVQHLGLDILGFGSRNSNTCRDTVRHEFGHALWDVHWRVLRKLGVQSTFDPDRKCSDPNCPTCILTEYGRTDPAEDFCETFSVLVRRAGRFPKSIKCQVIKDKWRFLRDVGQSLNNR
jgi:hypothetical protein